MNELMESQLGQRRSLMMLLGSFAGLAVLLAAIGLNGLISYLVVHRTRELSIRRALGALETDILSQVMGVALALTLVGVSIGVAGAAGAAFSSVAFEACSSFLLQPTRIPSAKNAPSATNNILLRFIASPFRR